MERPWRVRKALSGWIYFSLRHQLSLLAAPLPLPPSLRSCLVYSSPPPSPSLGNLYNNLDRSSIARYEIFSGIVGYAGANKQLDVVLTQVWRRRRPFGCHDVAALLGKAARARPARGAMLTFLRLLPLPSPYTPNNSCPTLTRG